MRDAWRLAAGTLTGLPTRAPTTVDSAVARGCVLVSPVAVWPLGVSTALVGALVHFTDLSGLVAGFLALALLALGTRVLHWDGLSDTVDGLTASYDPVRSLEVMKSGTSGPAGVVATVVVAGLQVASLAVLLASWRTAVLAGVAVLASRAALSLTCRAGVRPARREGLGHPLAEVVPSWVAAAHWAAMAAALITVGHWAGLPWWQPLVATALAVLVVLALVRHVTRRLGGVTGDVYGAAVELTLATLLIVLSA